MNGTHTCPGPECDKTVPDEMLACSRHWYQVSPAVRKAVWRAWKGGDGAGSTEHTAAIHTAIRQMRP